ncbi:MAG TPA: TonB-dependent receptor plug domain-containing protein, partial [Opitutaceae bacterium]|nr:TonB-dependent receptor plug domain-containing protein [Opitutaceae bacterium]
MLTHIRTRLLFGALIIGGACSAFAQDASPTIPVEPSKKDDNVVELEKFVADEKPMDAAGIMTTRPVSSAFGFDKSLVDTPRAITVVSQQQLDATGIRNSEDLVKVAPGTFSNFRFGLQGNVSIRNQTSDFYFRGMKRIDPQGNFRTVWNTNDSLEIIRGPASPIYGLGRIGGYTNFSPKTGRASTGKYLDEETGNIKVTYGSYDRKIISGEITGPAKIFGKEGGYALYGYIENSNGYKTNSFHEDEIVQFTYSTNVAKEIRLESGLVIQHSYGGLPGGDNRTTRDTIKDQTYWRGGFSYKMDENGDGKISEREVRDSYYGGTAQT